MGGQMRKLFIALLCVSLVGCATTAGYKAVLNSWVGTNESALISSWGVPQNSYVMADGQRAIEYIKSTNVQTGGHTYTEAKTTYHYYGPYPVPSTQYVTHQVPIQNFTYWCKTTFIVNSSGTIQTWRFEGNNCVAMMPPKEKSDQPQEAKESFDEFSPIPDFSLNPEPNS